MADETKTIFVVDEDGATFVFAEQSDAEKYLVNQAWAGAVHLTITRCDTAPAELHGDSLTDWAITNVPPITCEAQ